VVAVLWEQEQEEMGYMLAEVWEAVELSKRAAVVLLTAVGRELEVAAVEVAAAVAVVAVAVAVEVEVVVARRRGRPLVMRQPALR